MVLQSLRKVQHKNSALFVLLQHSTAVIRHQRMNGPLRGSACSLPACVLRARMQRGGNAVVHGINTGIVDAQAEGNKQDMHACSWPHIPPQHKLCVAIATTSYTVKFVAHSFTTGLTQAS
jgi:hypothetical protein